jgi:hypothetical protein
MLKAAIAILVVLVAVAYVAGGWSERRNCAPIQARLAEVEARLVQADERAKVASLTAGLLQLRDEVARQNYGEARRLSTPFFDRVRAGSATAHDAQVRQALASLLTQRDRVTDALARGDAEALALLEGAIEPLRRVLADQSVPGVESAASAPAVASSPSASPDASATPAPLGTPSPSALPGATAVPSTTLPVSPVTLPSPGPPPPFDPPASTLAPPPSTLPPAPSRFVSG